MKPAPTEFLDRVLREKVFPNSPNPGDALAELSRMFVQKHCSRKEILVHAGEKWSRTYFIHKGLIRLFYTDLKGREFNKGFYQEGELVWPVAHYAREKESLFSIAAIEDTIFFFCGFDRFYGWLKAHGVWEKFALPYAEKLAGEKFLREYEFLINSAAERYQTFLGDNPQLAERIPAYHLASYLGITDVSLSRIKKNGGS